MGFAVPFVYADWILAYPAFVNVPQTSIEDGAVPIAEIYWRNDGTSPATTPELQRTLLWLAVAHVAQLMYGSGANPQPSGLVGRVSSATEGSVSVGVEMPGGASPSAAWWQQTSYGATFWQATAAFRTMRYIPPTNKRYFGTRGTWPYGR